MTRTSTPGPVVVGVDGSPASVTAVLYAVAEARLRGARVRAVSAYGYSDSGREAEIATTRAQQSIDRARLAAGDRWPDDEPDVQVAEGPVAEVLHAASRDAVLLVVGADPHGLLGRVLEGSVLPTLTWHVHVPTVIVPLDWAEDPRRDDAC